MPIRKYPRQPGSQTAVDENDWNQDAPFGRCPACGSLGIEEIAIPGDAEIAFYCSDMTCRDPQGRRTSWGTIKTTELLEAEGRGDSWNTLHFPGQELPEVCPD